MPTTKRRPAPKKRPAKHAADQPARYGGISDAAVLKATGRGWKEWFRVLRTFGVKNNGHKAAAAFVHDEHKCPPWWSQMVVVAFEQATGLREALQKSDGFSASSSRTMAAPLSKVYRAWRENARAAWLPDPGVRVRKSTPNKSMRMTWVDCKTSVEVNFYSKAGKDGMPKSQVTVQHNKLTSAAQARKMKAYWGAALDALRDQLEG